MAARRLASRTSYTRRQAADILGVSERTVIRWQGRSLHPIRDPQDPAGRRWLYSRSEVDNLARRRRLSSSKPAMETSAQSAPVAPPGPAEPVVPGPVAARVYAMLRDGKSIDEIVEAAMVAPEQVIHLAELKERFEAARARKAHPGTLPSKVTSPDLEMEEWERKLDAERREWGEAQKRGGGKDDSPPSSDGAT